MMDRNLSALRVAHCLRWLLLPLLLIALQAGAALTYAVTEVATGNSGWYGTTLNNSGQVTGTATPIGHAFLWNGTSLQDLGTLGGLYSSGNAINENGRVTGQAADAAGDNYAYLWNGSTMLNLGALGGTSSVGNAINISNQVVGWANSVGGGLKAFLWTNGGMSELSSFGGSSVAVAINDSGRAAGYAWESGDATHRAVVWVGTSGMLDLGTLGGANSSARAINANGWVTGKSQTGTGVEHAFLWNGSQMINIGSGLWSEGFRINSKGQVLGRFGNNSGFQRAFVWDGRKVIDLGTFEGVNVAGDSFGRSINSSGDVVGWADDSSAGGSPFTGFLWSAGRMIRLQDLLPSGSRWRRIEQGIEINDRGQILVIAHDDVASESRLLLLTPPGKAPPRRR